MSEPFEQLSNHLTDIDHTLTDVSKKIRLEIMKATDKVLIALISLDYIIFLCYSENSSYITGNNYVVAETTTWDTGTIGCTFM